MTRILLAAVGVCLLNAVASAQAPPPAAPAPPAAPGTAATIGEKIDRGLSQIGAELSQGWAEIRKSVDKMGVQGRVYGRLHWDKSLQDATLDVEVRDGQVVVLKGSVASAEAKQKAVQLARDTIGVNSVVDELAVGRTASR